MSASDADSLNWLSWLYTIGAWGVVIGVGLESAEIFARRSAKRKMRRFIGPLQNSLAESQTPSWAHTIGDIGFLFLVVALVVEQVCHQRMEGITDRERNRLTAQLDSTTTNVFLAIDRVAIAEKEAGQARVQAGEANERASKFDFDRAELDKQTEELRAKNLELQKQLQPRTITLIQMTNFIFLTEKIVKIPIKIALSGGQQEAVNYAYQIRDTLNQAGFLPETNSGVWGLDIRAAAMFHRISRADTNWADVAFFTYGTNTIPALPSFNFEYTNGFARPIVTETNNEKIYNALAFVFRQIGIKYEWSNTTSWGSPGEPEFFVMDRAK